MRIRAAACSIAAGLLSVAAEASPPAPPKRLAFGAPAGSWVNVTSNLASMDSECGNVSPPSAKPDEDLMILGISLHGLWSSADKGASWQPLGKGSGSDVVVNRMSQVVYDPSAPATFWEVGTYNDAGVYKTTNGGSTFSAFPSTHHDDSVSVDFADPARKTVLVGGHEARQTVWLSTDGGAHFVNVGANLPAGSNFSSAVLVIDSHTFLVGCAGWGGGASGIFRSSDAGATWTQVSPSGGYALPLRASDGTIYWSKDNNNGLVRSGDQGKTWKDIVGWGVLQSLPPVELPDGRIVAVGTQNLMLSSDQGGTWTSLGPAFPFAPTGMAYSGPGRAFYITYFTCDFNSGDFRVPADAVMRLDLDYQLF